MPARLVRRQGSDDVGCCLCCGRTAAFAPLRSILVVGGGPHRRASRALPYATNQLVVTDADTRHTASVGPHHQRSTRARRPQRVEQAGLELGVLAAVDHHGEVLPS